MFILTLEWFGLPDERKRHGIQLEYGFKGKTNDELRQAWMARGRAVHGRGRDRRPGAPRRRGDRWVIDCPFPARFDEEAKRWLLDEGPISWDDVMARWKGARPDERGVRRHAAARLPQRRSVARARLTREDGRGAAVDGAARRRGPGDPDLRGRHGADRLARLPAEDARAVDLELTFTAMGCPAMDFIQDDIRERLLQEPDVDDGAHRGRVGPGLDAQPHPRGRARDACGELGIVA